MQLRKGVLLTKLYYQFYTAHCELGRPVPIPMPCIQLSAMSGCFIRSFKDITSFYAIHVLHAR